MPLDILQPAFFTYQYDIPGDPQLFTGVQIPSLKSARAPMTVCRLNNPCSLLVLVTTMPSSFLFFGKLCWVKVVDSQRSKCTIESVLTGTLQITYYSNMHPYPLIRCQLGLFTYIATNRPQVTSEE